MSTAFLLMAQYNGAAVIPLDTVCRDYFCHLTPVQFARKATEGEIIYPWSGSKPARRPPVASTFSIWRSGSTRAGPLNESSYYRFSRKPNANNETAHGYQDSNVGEVVPNDRLAAWSYLSAFVAVVKLR